MNLFMCNRKFEELERQKKLEEEVKVCKPIMINSDRDLFVEQ